MKSRILLVALALAATPAHADIIIRQDRGGVLSDYQRRVAGLHGSAERIVVDGLCASACTLHLTLPPGRVCATDRAVFMFHSVTDKQFGLPDWRANEQMYDAWPPRVRYAVLARGGLWLNPIRIKGTTLVPRCGR